MGHAQNNNHFKRDAFFLLFHHHSCFKKILQHLSQLSEDFRMSIIEFIRGDFDFMLHQSNLNCRNFRFREQDKVGRNYNFCD